MKREKLADVRFGDSLPTPNAQRPRLPNAPHTPTEPQHHPTSTTTTTARWPTRGRTTGRSGGGSRSGARRWTCTCVRVCTSLYVTDAGVCVCVWHGLTPPTHPIYARIPHTLQQEEEKEEAQARGGGGRGWASWQGGGSKRRRRRRGGGALTRGQSALLLVNEMYAVPCLGSLSPTPQMSANH